MEKKLFTPGPLTVSSTVKQALTRTLGSRDNEFIQIVRTIRTKLVEISGLPQSDCTAVLMQGSGTFTVEAVLNATSDRKKKTLILACGAYGMRMQQICEKAKIPSLLVGFDEDQPVVLNRNIMEMLDSEEFGCVAVVHCETTSGLINSIHQIGQEIKSAYPHMIYIVDAMSSFGGVQADYSTVDFLISSANKCIQGVPGFAFVICKVEALDNTRGQSTSLSLDLYEQWRGLEGNGQFRFTPPTHCVLGFLEALKELEDEGGVEGRAKRYKENNKIIKEGMKKLGFERFIADEFDGHIITSFKYLEHPNFDFSKFYDLLSLRGQLIYPGKVTNANCFRIGNIGYLFPEDMKHLLECIQSVLQELEIPLLAE